MGKFLLNHEFGSFLLFFMLVSSKENLNKYFSIVIIYFPFDYACGELCLHVPFVRILPSIFFDLPFHLSWDLSFVLFLIHSEARLKLSILYFVTLLIILALWVNPFCVKSLVLWKHAASPQGSCLCHRVPSSRPVDSPLFTAVASMCTPHAPTTEQ